MKHLCPSDLPVHITLCRKMSYLSDKPFPVGILFISAGCEVSGWVLGWELKCACCEGGGANLGAGV